MQEKAIKQVWINPWKYWAVTSKLSTQEADSLMEQVLRCVQAGDERALQNYDFVTLENPYFAWKRRRSVKDRKSVIV